MDNIHILNGDALKSQFPSESILGEIIVMRECLVYGDVNGNTIDELIACRAQSLNEMYGSSREEYIQKVAPEFQKIFKIEEGEVHLWFEDDLFCQVNLWFTCSLLEGKSVSAYLIRPSSSLRYGFGGLDEQDLLQAFKNKQAVTQEEIVQFSKLWKAYQEDDTDSLVDLSQKMMTAFPFLQDAVQAQIDRIPYGNGLPERTLKEIVSELSSQDFGLVFQEFSKRLPIYGFGDLQVKRLFDRLQEN